MDLPWLPCPAATVMEMEAERERLRKYHNMEGVQLKKAHSSIPLSHALPLSLSPSLHLSLQTKGYAEKLLKN